MAKPTKTFQRKRDEALNKVIDNVSRLERSGAEVNAAAVAVALWLSDPYQGKLVARLTHGNEKYGRLTDPLCCNVLYVQTAAFFGNVSWDKQGSDESRRADDLQQTAYHAGLTVMSVELDCENINGFLHEFSLPKVGMSQLEALCAGVEANTFTEERLQIIRAVCASGHHWNRIRSAPLDNSDYLKVLVGHCSPELRAQLLTAPDGVRVAVMQEAIHQHRNEWVSVMLDNGLSPDRAESKFGMRPLQIAAGNVEASRLLIDRGANVNATDLMAETPLHFAAEDPSVCKLLIESGARLDALSEFQYTPLHVALDAPIDRRGNAVERRVEVVQVMLDHGADPFYMPAKPRSDYLTPFQVAVAKGDVRQAEAVTQRFEVDFGQRTLAGRTLAQIAGKNEAMKNWLRSVKTHAAVVIAVDAALSRQPAVHASRGLSPL
jgi:ankyrin repeat protein